MSIAVILIDREQAEEFMAKISELADAVGTLTAKVNDAVTLLNSPLVAAADDPAVEFLLTKVNEASTNLQAAVDAYKAAHPAQPPA